MIQTIKETALCRYDDALIKTRKDHLHIFFMGYNRANWLKPSIANRYMTALGQCEQANRRCIKLTKNCLMWD